MSDVVLPSSLDVSLWGETQRAVFLDRDGTINIEKGYLSHIEDFEFIPGVPQALKRLQDAGFLLVVVTNQSGVARGYFTLDEVKHLHQYMCTELLKYGVYLAGIYLCPHHPTAGEGDFTIDCDCRKGKPGLLIRAAEELNIDLGSSFMIGDKLSDVQAGLNAGCMAYLVGKQYPATSLVQSTYIVTDFPEAVAKILVPCNS